ncbi:MurR/RpiR family transcriptional regulator [Sneathiella chinensis]|uniref:Silent information regulator protein Sir2 n=1 Tax=Sneathiella chinensis TaxID=349750 RepID=A0ABQ5U0V5_9PROT|nr:MurR/RpiR family transcriptional regulator [Sneathiella chinensis]GLQ05790.1 silent information regulator protein Sir2 [Sneathiella chinensis]
MSETLQEMYILDRLEQDFEALSPQLKQAARFVLDCPNEVATHSMREIALRAGVKPATMVRLSNRMGFAGYNEFRETFRDRLTQEGAGYAARARQMQMKSQTGEGQGLVADLVAAETGNIENSFLNVSDADLDTAARIFLEADRVFIVGLRKCYPLAHYFHYATRVFFQNSRLLTGFAGLFSEEVSAIGERDAVLVIAFDPYTRETVEAANRAREVGAGLVAITDSVVSPLAKEAGASFVVGNRSPSFYRSLVGALAIVQALVAALVNRLGEEAVTALERSDSILRSNNTYWNG